MPDVNTITDGRQMRALTGLGLATFCALAEPFARDCRAEADARFSGGATTPTPGWWRAQKAGWLARNRGGYSSCIT